MKAINVAFVSLALVGMAQAANKTDLDYRIHKLTAKFEAMQQKADRRVPAERLKDACGIILLDRTKAGFLFAFQGGAGVALLKDPKNGKWSPPAFVSANEASLGFQIGGQQSFVVILLMTTNAAAYVANGNFDFGGEARGTAGDQSGGAEGTISSIEQPVLVYDDRKGLYGGATIKGDAISPDAKANYNYYGQFLSINEILVDRKVKPTEAAEKLTESLNRNSKLAKN